MCQTLCKERGGHFTKDKYPHAHLIKYIVTRPHILLQKIHLLPSMNNPQEILHLLWKTINLKQMVCETLSPISFNFIMLQDIKA